jgi:hypothetical protein
MLINFIKQKILHVLAFFKKNLVNLRMLLKCLIQTRLRHQAAFVRTIRFKNLI